MYWGLTMSQSTDEKVNEVTARYQAEAKAAGERARRELAAQGEPEHDYDRWLRQRREQDAQTAQEKA
jgi:hypothetical protein